MARGHEGSRYEETRGESAAQIAKRIRRDIAEAIEDGMLPKGLKVSVRCGGGRTSSSIDQRITSAPWRDLDSPGLYAFDAVLPHLNHPHYLWTRGPLTWFALDRLDRLAAQYNYDNSDIQTDYFDVRFYGHAEVDWKYAAARREAWLKANEAQLADLRVMKEAAGPEATARYIVDAFRPAGVELNNTWSIIREARFFSMPWAELAARFEPATAPASFVGAAKTVAELVDELLEEDDEPGPVLSPSACVPQPAQTLADLKRALAKARAENARLREEVAS